MTESRPNAEQVEYWNTIAGPKWLALQEQFDRQLEPYGRAALDAAAPSHGVPTLDIGCGCGSTTLAIAEAVNPATVLGVDISAGMVARARETAEARGIRNARFELGDAQTHRFPAGAFDLAFSRFGVMFFDDPVTAFRNIGSALSPRARMVFICWQSVDKNPWMALPMMAAKRHVQVEGPAGPNAPGPFAFANADRVRTILGDAGFSRIDVTPFTIDMLIAGGVSLEPALDFILRSSPVSRSLDAASPAARDAAIDAVREAIAPFEKSGVVSIPSAAWIVTSQRRELQ